MIEKIPYRVVKKVGNFEIRKYPEIVVATVKDDEENSAFNFLFQYISGNNKSKKKIAMTAPVISSEKIAMTSPVISKNGYMAFSLPKKYSKENVPVPINSKVSIAVIPERLLAVFRFSGKTSKKSIEKYTWELQNQLTTKGLTSTGEVFLMRYNSPFTPGFLRRNEVAIELKNVVDI